MRVRERDETENTFIFDLTPLFCTSVNQNQNCYTTRFVYVSRFAMDGSVISMVCRPA